MNSPRCFFVFGSYVAFALVNTAVAADLTTLMSRSPFSAPGGVESASGLPEPVSSLEFRGMAVEAQGVFFSVFDATANRGYWLREGTSAGSLRVAGFDAESSTLEVEQNGRALKLSLKQAATATSATLPILVTNAAAPGPIRRVRMPGVQPPVSDTERMAQIAKIVRDRRAARLAARPVGTGQPTSPGL